MKYYLNATFLEAIERAKKMKTKFPNQLNLYIQSLAKVCQTKIDDVIDELDYFKNNEAYQNEKNQKSLLSKLKELISILDILENVVVAAINRFDENDDEKVNKLVQKICKEINYPLLPPTVTCLSQEYYRIFPDFNLLCLPLLECEFLLHLPDLYHELGHPLLTEENNPKNEKYKKQLSKFISHVNLYYRNLINDAERNNDIQYVEFYRKWKSYWINWAIEFFCDLFGTYTVGPAYAWAHLHLTAKRGGNPFDVKKFGDYSSHPNDEARMIVQCFALDLLGFQEEKNKILKQWTAFKKIIPYQEEDAFEMAYPNELLEFCAVIGLQAAKDIGCTIASKSNQGQIYQMLNQSWVNFWDDAESYFEWEANELKKI